MTPPTDGGPLMFLGLDDAEYGHCARWHFDVDRYNAEPFVAVELCSR